jgi:hypothetical protein
VLVVAGGGAIVEDGTTEAAASVVTDAGVMAEAVVVGEDVDVGSAGDTMGAVVTVEPAFLAVDPHDVAPIVKAATRMRPQATTNRFTRRLVRKSAATPRDSGR